MSFFSGMPVYQSNDFPCMVMQLDQTSFDRSIDKLLTRDVMVVGFIRHDAPINEGGNPMEIHACQTFIEELKQGA